MEVLPLYKEDCHKHYKSRGDPSIAHLRHHKTPDLVVSLLRMSTKISPFPSFSKFCCLNFIGAAQYCFFLWLHRLAYVVKPLLFLFLQMLLSKVHWCCLALFPLVVELSSICIHNEINQMVCQIYTVWTFSEAYVI